MIEHSPTVPMLEARELLQHRDAVVLLADTIDLWAIHLCADDTTLACCRKLLSSSERTRAERFHFREDGDRFILAHALLRRILARYTGLGEGELQFAIGEQGKPRLANLPHESVIHFNLSHSGDAAVVAVAACEVGVDIERDRSNIDIDAIAGRYFFGAEARAIAAAPPAMKSAAFLQHWVAKEALLKGVGLGIGAGLDGFQVRLHPDFSPVEVRTFQPEVIDPGWYVQLLTCIPNYHVAIAARGANWRTRSHFKRHDPT